MSSEADASEHLDTERSAHRVGKRAKSISLSRRSSSEVHLVHRGQELSIDAEPEWLIRAPADVLAALETEVPTRALNRVAGELALVRFGNYVGRFRFAGYVLNVRSGKWGAAHYEQMLSDVTSRAAALPFAASGGAIPFDRTLSERVDVALHAFLYLRHILSESAPQPQRLLPALSRITHAPHYRMETDPRVVTLSRARRVPRPELLRIASGRVVTAPALCAAAATPLARALGGRLPTHLITERRRRELDTAENRFVRHFIETAVAICRAVEALGDSALERSALDVRAQLEPLLFASPFKHASKLSRLPTQSTTLQRRGGYRDVFRHYFLLRTSAHIPIEPSRLSAFASSKDIATLYELWCYFEVVAPLTDLLGPPHHATSCSPQRTHVSLPQNAVTTWPGVRCHYNLSFTKGGRYKTRSHNLRPDIVVEIADGPAAGLHVFDAKFKRAVRKNGDAKAKVDDIDKMHAYRDALVGVRSAMVLFPGDEATWHGREDYELGGVGALPLVPGRQNGALVERLERLVHRAALS